MFRCLRLESWIDQPAQSREADLNHVAPGRRPPQNAGRSQFHSVEAHVVSLGRALRVRGRVRPYTTALAAKERAGASQARVSESRTQQPAANCPFRMRRS